MPGLNPFDSTVMTFVQQHFHNGFTDAVFPVITNLGEAGFFWIILALCLMIGKKYRICGLLMLLAMLGAFLTGELLLKNIICRPRPCHDYPDYVQMLVAVPHSFSFPSGHSSSSFAAAAVLFAHSKKWGIPALVLAFLIAFSRVFLFVHYPTDILAGTALGLLFALLTLFVYRRVVQPRLAKRRSQKSTP